MKHRYLNKIYAKFFGYFWLPCPLCGQMFGGHEWEDIDGKPSTIPDPDHMKIFLSGISNKNLRIALGLAICPDCTKDGKGVLE